MIRFSLTISLFYPSEPLLRNYPQSMSICLISPTEPVFRNSLPFIEYETNSLLKSFLQNDITSAGSLLGLTHASYTVQAQVLISSNLPLANMETIELPSQILAAGEEPERDDISLSQSTIALSGYAQSLQMVMTKVVPALTEVVRKDSATDLAGFYYKSTKLQYVCDQQAISKYCGSAFLERSVLMKKLICLYRRYNAFGGEATSISCSNSNNLAYYIFKRQANKVERGEKKLFCRQLFCPRFGLLLRLQYHPTGFVSSVAPILSVVGQLCL
ncbi:LOW QUALITY PROTEIN: hypothetical protein YC2023_066815 [Brassica napus]